jgi:hypothetical protein
MYWNLTQSKVTLPKSFLTTRTDGGKTKTIKAKKAVRENRSKVKNQQKMRQKKT